MFHNFSIWNHFILDNFFVVWLQNLCSGIKYIFENAESPLTFFFDLMIRYIKRSSSSFE